MNECSSPLPDGQLCLEDDQCVNHCDGLVCGACGNDAECAVGQYCLGKYDCIKLKQRQAKLCILGIFHLWRTSVQMYAASHACLIQLADRMDRLVASAKEDFLTENARIESIFRSR